MNLEVLSEQLQTEGEITKIQGDRFVEVSKIVYDTRKTVSKGALFVCIAGAVFDGHAYAEEAIKAGASVIVAQKELSVPETVTLVVVKDTRKALAYLSAAWFGYPAKELITIGITGTKGKTTTAYMVYHMLEKVGIKTGLVGTVEVRNGKDIISASHTTPESYLLQEYFRQMVENGCKAVVMEVSSQALKLSRVGGILFDYGVFTNIAPDHIGPNEHSSFEEYMGSLISVKTFAPVDGSKEFIGNLTGYDNGDVTVEVDGNERTFAKKDIAIVRLRIDF